MDCVILQRRVMVMVSNSLLVQVPPCLAQLKGLVDES